MAFKDLPSWAKGTVAIAGTLTVILGGYFAVRGINNIVKGKSSRDSSKATKSDLKNLNKNQDTAQTISDSQAEAYASSIFSALNGYGTDEDAIVSVFDKVKNEADVLAISNAFGVREVSSGSWNPEPNYKGDLSGALREDLSDYWVNKLNEVLADKGITFRF